MRETKILTFACLAAAGVATTAHAALRPYTGVEATLWSSSGSWSGSTLPGSGVDSVSLRSTTTATGSTFDLADGFTITGLSAGSRTSDSGDTLADHTINLNARTLNVDGNVTVGEVNGSGSFTGAIALRNGTLSVANGIIEVGVREGGGTAGTGTISGGSDFTFASTSLAGLKVGFSDSNSGTGNGTVNFADAAGGTLNVAGGTNTIQIGVRLAGSSGGTTPQGSVTLGQNWTSTTLGASDNRAGMRVGFRGNTNGGAIGSFTQSGGTFTAYLSNLEVGHTTSTQDQPLTTGTVDLAGVSGLLLDVDTLRIGTSRPNISGTVSLGAGEVLINTAATIGGGNSGALNLDGTSFVVASGATLSLASTGQIDATIGDTSTGVEILNPLVAAFSISSTVGTSNRGLEITFEQNPTDADWVATAAQANGIFYGFKWAGDKVAALTDILNGTDNVIGNSDDRIRWYDSALTGQFAGKVGIFYDGIGAGTLGTDATYIGFYVSVIPEPSVTALLGLVALPLARRRR